MANNSFRQISIIGGKESESTVNLLSANDNDSGKNNIFLPSKEQAYGTTNDDTQKQFLVTSVNNPESKSKNDEANLILKYIRDEKGGKIHWVKDLETLGEFPNKVSQTITRTLPIGDFFTDVQTNVDNYTSSTNHILDEGQTHTKYKWINVGGTVVNVGLNQLTWNTNKQYHFNEAVGNSILYVECENSFDEKLGFKIKYLIIDNHKVIEKVGFYEKIEDYKSSSNKLQCFKVNSIELLPTSRNRSYNMGNIEFYFKPEGRNLESTNFKNGIDIITWHNPSDQDINFSYNCNYLNGMYTNCETMNCGYMNCQYMNCQYTNNEYYNMFLNRNLPKTNMTQISKEWSEEFDLSFISKRILTDTIKGTDFELEGGNGRKAVLTIRNNDLETNKRIQIKISNPGYLYQEGDLLRIKDTVYKNEIFFTVNSLKDTISLNIDTKFTQEFIKAHHGRSNTLKYALPSDHCLLIKDLSINGSTKSKILVRLIEVTKPIKFNNTKFDDEDKYEDNNIQNVIKEFYYFNRDINEIHSINKLVNPESEIFVDLQKLIDDEETDNKIDTLSFTLNGIKIKLDEENTTGDFIMERTI